MSEKTSLKRVLSLPQLILYGLGTTIGAGIYALVGDLAAVSGYMAPAAFLIASLIAGLTALSFAELGGRFPFAAGTAKYVREGFSSPHLSTLTGLLVIAAGLVSAAAMVNGFTGYLYQFLEIERPSAILMVVLVLGLIAAWGIAESVSIAGLVTLIEIGGLIMIIMAAHFGLDEISSRWRELIPVSWSNWHSIYAGSLLAFYAYIGFEDMVVVAEEVKKVRRNLPIAIITTLLITTCLYLLIMVCAIFALPLDELAASDAALVRVYEHYSGKDTTIISIIGMFAIINGALIQIIMASRVLYGMSSRRQLPAFLSRVNPHSRTPLHATFLVTGIVLVLALSGRLASLAEMTSIIMLIIFAAVNLALLRIKHADPKPEGIMIFPYWVPLLGFLVSSGFVISEIINQLMPSQASI